MRVIQDKDVEKLGGYFSTGIGISTLKILTELFVDRNCFDANSQRMTDFMLGQRELIRFLQGTVKAMKEE